MDERARDWISDGPFRRHTVLLVSVGGNQLVVAFGVNRDGQFGLGHKNAVEGMVVLTFFKTILLKQVACGCEYTLFLTGKWVWKGGREEEDGGGSVSGEVWACGSGDYGQLGTGDTKEQLVPVKVKLPPGVKVVGLFAGYWYSALLSSTGDVYTLGYDSVGQQGQGSTAVARCSPVKMDLGGEKRVVDVGCGINHTMVLTNEREVWGMGYDAHGELGSGKQGTTSHPRKVLIPAGVRVARVECGGSSTFLLSGEERRKWIWGRKKESTEQGQLYSCGRNEYFQLGHGDQENRPVPTPIEFFQDKVVVEVQVGHSHCLATTDAGDCFVWGYGKAGECGTGEEKHVQVPTKLDALRNCLVVAPGYSSTIALTADKQLVGFGTAEQLGFADEKKRLSPIPLQLPQGCTFELPEEDVNEKDRAPSPVPEQVDATLLARIMAERDAALQLQKEAVQRCKSLEQALADRNAALLEAQSGEQAARMALFEAQQRSRELEQTLETERTEFLRFLSTTVVRFSPNQITLGRHLTDPLRWPSVRVVDRVAPPLSRFLTRPLVMKVIRLELSQHRGNPYHGMNDAQRIAALDRKVGELEQRLEVMRLFRSEIGAMMRLQHDRLVCLRGYNENTRPEHGLLFVDVSLLIDRCDTSMERLLPVPGLPIPPMLPRTERIQLLMDLLEALVYMHANDMLHRDVKPENMFVNGQPGERRGFLGDFGIAEFASAFVTSGAAYRGRATPGYASPEYRRGGNEVRLTDKHDIFAFGITMWEILVWRRAWMDMRYREDDHRQPMGRGDIARAIVRRGRPDRLPEENPGGMPAEQGLCDCIRACWADNPAQRPTAAHVFEYLRRVKQVGDEGQVPNWE